MDLDGFVKVLADAATDEILGICMIGARSEDVLRIKIQHSLKTLV